ncbi:helix-turn-helix domain-containing protein [Corynebacterium uterequi]|uniref:Uncharacterized protein n=1 Tax=Corynebacterium uterequi TaxID=1072256 RepID=A0A0G3HAQ1_9CORY|nr:hypothetical protein [Corynebacterium uterequi]AKK10419.1 hypothetical protein CUTER_02020 [Corynebacterium uterequi]
MSGLTPELVMQLMEAGESQAAIARAFKVSRQYVHKLAKQGGHETSQRLSDYVSRHFPWDIIPEANHSTLHQNIRLLALWNLDQSALERGGRLKLRAFLNKLNGFQQVVDYNPNYKAVKGLNNKPGFAYVPRTPEDEGMAIKIRPGIRLTDEGRKLWAMPKELPESI